MSSESIEKLKAGDDSEPLIITRFSIMIMAITLLGMGVGATLPPGCGVVSLGGGLIGLIAYLCVEQTARQRRHLIVDWSRKRAEHRLVRHARCTDGDRSESQEQPETAVAIGG